MGKPARGTKADLPKIDESIREIMPAESKRDASFAKKLGQPEIRELTAYLRTLKR